MATSRSLCWLMFKSWRSRLKLTVVLFALLLLVYILGAFDYISQLDYFEEYQYPYEGDIGHYVSQLKSGETPDLAPITRYDYAFKIGCEDKCREPGWQSKYQEVKLLLVIKS